MQINNIYNIVGFQICWWSCVLGVVNDYQYLGPIAMTMFLLVHFICFSKNIREIYFVVIIGIFGVLIDSSFLTFDIIKYKYPILNSFAPLWIISMWIGFASTINHSMYWLNGQHYLMALFGFVFGPLSYLAGLNFEALIFEKSLSVLLILGVVWAFSLPLMFFLNNKIMRAS